ncbi:uncharacterized protein LOC134824604 isoform X2 [Bolinopsis microptera]|uniref:uncharacterized protein LOC134824604 isoform X2 n=1 Tax=Bolinopsis microptera TaxID=2820187 RepID=UPI003079AEB6
MERRTRCTLATPYTSIATPYTTNSNMWSNKTANTLETNRDSTISSQYKDYLYSNKFRTFSDDSTNSTSNNPELSIDINGKIKMSNCEVDADEEFDIRSLSSMRMKKLISSMEYISVNEDKENQVSGKKPEMFSTLPLRKHSSMGTNLGTNSPLRPNKRVHSVEIPVTALPGDQSVFQTDLDQGVAKLRVTPDEAREIMKFINEKIASRTSMQTAGTDTVAARPPQECVPEEPSVAEGSKIKETPPPIPSRGDPMPSRGDPMPSRGEDTGSESRSRIHRGFNSMPLMHRSGDQISVKEVETSPPEEVNDLNEEKPDGAKPKLSFMNKLKKSFKSCNSDKNKSPTIPQLSRPPSSYIGSQMSLNHSSVHGSVHSLTLQHAPPLEKPQTPVLELLSKNPEMCSQDSLNRITRMPEVQAEEVGEVKAVMSDPDLVASTTTGRSRSAKRDDKTKRRSRSKSLTKLIGGMARKAKSLTNVSPIPKKSEDKSPDYVNDIPGGGSVAPPVPLSPPPPLPVAEPEVEEEKPEKKPRLSLVGRLKRKLSIGRGDKAAKVEKRKELSKSTPVLNQGPPPASALPLHIKRAKSTENMSTTSSVTTTTDVRTQIVLKSAKINKGCRCQVCSLVRRNIRSHCNSADPNSRHKYEVVLKMNILGGDFMNSECGSVASYQGNQGYEVPDEERPDIVEGCIAGNIDAEISSIHSVDNQLRTKTQSEIHELVADFQQETKSVSSHHSHQSDTDNDMSELRNLISTPLSELRSSPSLTPRQSAV